MLSTLIEKLFEIILSFEFIFILFLLILISHIIIFLIKDLLYVKAVKRHKDPEKIELSNIKVKPLVNIIIPAWKEGKVFRKCLRSIKELSYPNLKIIVNAGGSNETKSIASEFEDQPNFTILEQKEGKRKAALGKIKALNEALDHVSEGLIYFIDADCYLTDEILLRIIFPITNHNEDVVVGGIRPLKSQEEIDLVRYIELKRIRFAKKKYSRYLESVVGGASTCVKNPVMKEIDKFNESRNMAEDLSRGIDISQKGFKILFLNHYRSKIYTEYPDSLNEYYKVRRRYFENGLIKAVRENNVIPVLKLLILFILSLYIVISPFLAMFKISFLFFSLLIILSFYLKRVRRYFFYKLVFKDNNYPSFNKLLFVKVIFFIIFEIFTNIIAFLLILKNFRRILEGE